MEVVGRAVLLARNGLNGRKKGKKNSGGKPHRCNNNNNNNNNNSEQDGRLLKRKKKENDETKKKKPTQKNTKRNDQEILVPVFRAGCFRSRHSVVFIFFLSMFNSQRSVWLGPSGIFFLGFLFLARFFFVGRAVAVSRFAYHVMATGGSTFWCADRSFRFTFFFVILWRGLLRKTTQSFLIFACPFLLFEHTHFFRYFLSLLPFSSIARFCNVAPSFRLLFCRFVVLPPAP